MIRLAASLLFVALGLGSPALADAGEGGFAGIRLLYDIDFERHLDGGSASEREATRAALIAAIGHRIAPFDVEAVVRTQGDDRIVVILGGQQAAGAQAAISRGQGYLAMHMVEQSLPTAQPTPAPQGFRIVPDAAGTGAAYLIDAEPALDFGAFASATVEIDPMMRAPIVRFVLTDDGARVFGEVTGANVGRRLAIVFNGVVISAPVIQTAILGGIGVITGNFDMDDARELADAINAGVLPVPIELAEVRTIFEASPPIPPGADAGALAVELMFTEEGPLDPLEIVAAVRALGLGKAAVQFLDAGDRSVVVTMALPPGGDEGRLKAVARIGDYLEGRYLVRAYWRLGPAFLLNRDIGPTAG